MTEDRDKWRKYVHGMVWATLGSRTAKEHNRNKISFLLKWPSFLKLIHTLPRLNPQQRMYGPDNSSQLASYLSCHPTKSTHTTTQWVKNILYQNVDNCDMLTDYFMSPSLSDSAANLQKKHRKNVSRPKHKTTCYKCCYITLRNLMYIGNESVPIQLTQCWFPGLVISNDKI